MINLRSPYFVITQQANLTQVDMTLYIHTGTQSTTTTGYQYALSATAITPASGNPYVVFDISELARDYLTNSFDGTYDCSAVWVNYQITTYTSGVADAASAVVKLQGFDGYKYFEEGVQSSGATYTAPDVLQSNTIIYKSDDGVLRVPVLQDNDPSVYFLHHGEITNSVTVTNTTTAADIIRYVDNEGASYDTFKERVEADSGTLEESALGDVFERYSTKPCDSVIVNVGGVITKLSVVDIPECRYEPYRLTFVNKFGAFQDLWFFKASSVSLNTEKQSYEANTQSIGVYSINEHQKKVFSKMGSETMSLNTGFYPESYNEVFRQLMLSEEVWIRYENNILPINIIDSGMDFKKSVNDKLINYTINVEFAFDKISNIR